MATILRLVQGAVTVDLNDVTNTELREDYAPTAADEKQDTTAESLAVIVKGADVAGLMTRRSTILEMLRRALDWKDGRSVDPVYIHFQPDGSATLYRSRLHSFTVSNEVGVYASPWDNLNTELTIAWERDNWWEGPEAQLPLSNTNGTDNTTGLPIFNCSDGSGSAPNDRVNYADVDGDDVAGDLPSACRLEITNTYNNARATGFGFVALNVHSAPATLPHIIEGETSTVGSQVADAACSGGNYRSCAAWNDTYETTLFSFALSTALLNATRGNFVRLIARFRDAPDADLITLRVKILLNISTLYVSPPIILSSRTIQDLCSLRLPPYLMRAGDVYPLTLQITGQHTNAGAHSLNLDFLQVTPVDGWRYYTNIGYDLAYNARLVDDGIEERLYSDGWSTAGAIGHYNAFGNPLRLFPGRDQRLYFLFRNDLGAAEIARTHSIKLYYRPRRLTL